MPTQRKSLRAKQRSNVIHAYRARGHRNDNLWLVYSIKTDRDWLLPSDRQLVHWVHCLETNRAVKTFDLAPKAVQGHDGKRMRATELDAEVICFDGHVEWHEVKAGDYARESSQLIAQASAANRAAVSYKVFNDRDLTPYTRTSIRWLKAIAFAAAIRGRDCMPARLALLAHVHTNESGTVKDVIGILYAHDPAVLHGLIVRFAIEGILELDLNKYGFGPRTPWQLVTKY